MSEEVQQPRQVKSNRGMQRFIIYASVLLVVFLLGFVPMWLKARSATSDLVETKHQLVLVSLQSNLAASAIDARRGDYEPVPLASIGKSG